MAKEHGELGLIVPELDDYAGSQADVPRAFEEYSDSLDEALTETKGKLFIAQGTGVAAFKAMKGDATIDEGGEFQLSADIHTLLGKAGKCIVSTEQTRESEAFGTLATPDRVEGIELEEDGLLAISYEADWVCTPGAVGQAAIFINGQQLKTKLKAETQAAFNTFVSSVPLLTDAAGLICMLKAGHTTVATGQPLAWRAGQAGSEVGVGVKIAHMAGTTKYEELVEDAGGNGNGGVCVVDGLPADTYTVEIRFATNGLKVKVKNRKLRVHTREFL